MLTLKRTALYSILLVLFLSAASMAQEKQGEPDYRKGTLEITFSGIKPGGDLKGSFSNAFAIGFNTGYRIQRYVQADFGVEIGLGSADVSRSINTTGGTRDVGDNEVFVPFGGRLVLPLAKERVLLSAGGGYSYLRYSESARGQGNEVVICDSCTSRSGWGPYEVVQAKFMVDQARRFGVGIMARWYQAHTEGEPLGTKLPARTKDRWVSIAGTLSLQF